MNEFTNARAGDAAEAAFQLYASCNGWEYAQPMSPALSYDFAALFDITEGWTKVQVKHAGWYTGKHYQADLRKGNGTKRRGYTRAEADYFFIYSIPLDQAWLVPVSNVPTCARINITMKKYDIYRVARKGYKNHEK